jgi:hypothetical protein
MMRDPRGYIGSEKVRYARKYLGSERFAGIQPPKKLIRKFQRYDLDAHILAWNVAFTRMVIKQELYKDTGKFIPLRYENLVHNTEGVMRALCENTDMSYDPILLNPTLMGSSWLGNSHYGQQKGVNPKLAEGYKSVLTEHEVNRIMKSSGPLIKYLESMKEPLPDFTKIPKELLFDYERHKQYFIEDDGKAIIYGALSNSNVRKYPLGFPGRFAGVALCFYYLMKLYRVPRNLLVKFLPNLMRRNYK